MAPVADSPLERAGFEPSVPRWGNYAYETVPFDRYSISRPFSGAAQRIDRCFRRIDQHRQALVEAEAIYCPCKILPRGLQNSSQPPIRVSSRHPSQNRHSLWQNIVK